MWFRLVQGKVQIFLKELRQTFRKRFFFDAKALLLISFSSSVVSSLFLSTYTNGIIITILSIIKFFLVSSDAFIAIESCNEFFHFLWIMNQGLLKININGISQPLPWAVILWLHWASTLPPLSCTLSLSGTENLYQVDWSNVGKEKKEMLQSSSKIFKKYPREP